MTVVKKQKKQNKTSECEDQKTIFDVFGDWLSTGTRGSFLGHEHVVSLYL